MPVGIGRQTLAGGVQYGDLVGREVPAHRAEVLFQLRLIADADHHVGDTRSLQQPVKGYLRHGLAGFRGHCVECVNHPVEILVVDLRATGVAPPTGLSVADSETPSSQGCSGSRAGSGCMGFSDGRSGTRSPAFAHSKQGMSASNQAAFLTLIGAEIPIGHFLIYLFDPVVAAVIAALSVYGFLFMLAEYRATLHRPFSVTDRGLHVRYGVASDFLVDWPSIATAAPTRGPVSRAGGRIRLVGMGEANVVIGLAPGTRVSGLAGSHEVEQIFLGVDDPAGLIAEIAPVARAIEAMSATGRTATDDITQSGASPHSHRMSPPAGGDRPKAATLCFTARIRARQPTRPSHRISLDREHVRRRPEVR